MENHKDTLLSLSDYLTFLGHAVLSAPTMNDALRDLPSAKCDVLISDIGLPDGDGWELLRRARLAPRVYTIAMSGFGQNTDRAKSESAGFRKHLLKPILPENLDVLLAEATAEIAKESC